MSVPASISCDVLPGCSLTKFQLISEADIKVVILKVKTTTCQLEPLPTSLHLDWLNVLFPAITNIADISLSTSVFPPLFKNALARPLLKKSMC